MRKDGLRAVIIVIVSVFIITGAGLFTNMLLDNMEKKLLSQTGKTYIKQAGISQTAEYVIAGEEAEEDAEEHDVELSLSDRYKILCSWADAEKSIQHQPLDGQIKKLYAVSVGKKWIDNLIENEYILINDNEKADFKMEYADLSTVYSMEVEDAGLLSMWNILYTCGNNRIIVTIHAATGEVWRTAAATYPINGKWQRDEYGAIIENSYDFVFNSEEDRTDYIEQDENEDTAMLSVTDEADAWAWSQNVDARYGNNIEVSMRENWMTMEYDGKYYDSLKAILSEINLKERSSEDIEYDAQTIDSKKKQDVYYMQTYSMIPNEGGNIGFRITKAEQYNEDGGYYVGFVMSMLPFEMAEEIAPGFNIYSPVYDK